jgi:ABC-type branched-subunit amino acid transport system substrate-binding protein
LEYDRCGLLRCCSVVRLYARTWSSRSATSARPAAAIAHLGKDNENGARMAIDELNAKGVTIGGKKVKLELVAKTTAAIRSRARVAQKLVDSKVNGVVGHLNSGTSIPASKVYSDAGIPQISPSAPTRSTPAKASRPRSASWPMTCTSAARSAATP